MAKKILVVDDENDVVDVVSARLRANNYKVVTASNGEEGLERAQIEKPDLIVLDVMMPGMDGTVMAEKLKDNPDTKNIPIIFLTCLVEKTEEKKQGHAIGGRNFLAKPYKPKDLLTMIEKIIG